MADDTGTTKKRKRRNRWGDAPPAASTTETTTQTQNGQAPSQDAKAKALALQESVRARLAALKSKQQQQQQVPNKRPADSIMTAETLPPVKKAKHFELDMSVTGPSFQEKPKPKVNPYLSTQTEEEEEVQDERLVRASKPRKRHKPLVFVEPGTFVEIAERKRKKAANALESGFSSGRKAGMYVAAADMANVYGGAAEEVDSASVPRADADPDTREPIVEWWDLELLPSKLKKQVTAVEGQALTKRTKAQLQTLTSGATKEGGGGDDEDEANVEELRKTCFEQASLSYSKTAALVQHIVPIETRTKPPPQPVLHLTKKERKRQRKLRRAEKQRELQDMQAAGLIPPPEPRLTLKNFIQVMGDQAFVDPSQMERKVAEQMQARQQAHLERNEAKKLTKEQRAEKRARKLQEDTTESVTVALFWVKDMSHPYHRAKVELNARQNNITGGVLECEHPSMACVICEGGPKAIKRYIRLMTVRMKWQGMDDVEGDEEDEDGTTHKFNPENKCELVWTGMGTRRLFKSFVFQSCESSDIARKVLKAKGVGHFWDQVLTHASGRGESFNLKLATEDGEEDEEEDIVMAEG
jgi:U4/U6 small nuclear ribonucleoprotein PRP3